MSELTKRLKLESRPISHYSDWETLPLVAYTDDAQIIRNPITMASSYRLSVTIGAEVMIAAGTQRLNDRLVGQGRESAEALINQIVYGKIRDLTTELLNEVANGRRSMAIDLVHKIIAECLP